MFASLKNKIKEETGSDVSSTAGPPPNIVTPHQRVMNHTVNTTNAINNSNNNNNRVKSRFSSSVSVTSNDDNSQVSTYCVISTYCALMVDFVFLSHFRKNNSSRLQHYANNAKNSQRNR